MPFPDTSLIFWQILVVTQLLGAIYALTRLFRQALSPKNKTAWCSIILFIPLGWIVYLFFRKQIVHEH